MPNQHPGTTSRPIPPERPNPLRTFIRLGPTALLAIVWTHALAALLANLLETAPEPGTWAWPLTVGAVVVAVTAAWTSRADVRLWPPTLVALLWGAALALHTPEVAWLGVALVPVAAGSAAVSAALGRRLARVPATSLRLRGWRRALWMGTVLLCLVQFARLGTWMSDPESDWFVTTRHPFFAKHECLPAYIHGAELGLRGDDNVYEATHYPGLNPQASPDTRMTHMAVEDPFQYMPQFLLWPAAAVSLTRDYPAVRSLWFALQTTAFLWLAAALAWWVGGRAGHLALWLLPLALSAFPVLHNLQYGQFHLLAVALGVVAMVAFDRGRMALGGGLLAVATLSKIFPGVLLVVLAAQRRFRELLWTAASGAALSAATLAVFGTAPFEAFVSYHLPRLQTGAAFAFGEAWPEFHLLLLAANHGVYGVVAKLAELGVPGLDEGVAVQVNRIYGVALLAAAWFVGRRAARFDRAQRAAVWLSLVGLASMMSTGAFADYVPVTATWLLTLLATRMARPAVAWTLGGIWASQYLLLFVAPLGDWFDPAIFLPLSTVSTLLMLGLLVWTVTLSLREASAREATTAQSQRPSGTMGGRLSEA